MIKSIQDGYNLLFWVFIIICLYGGTNSKEYQEDYIPVANNNRGDYSSLFGTLSERDLDD